MNDLRRMAAAALALVLAAQLGACGSSGEPSSARTTTTPTIRMAAASAEAPRFSFTARRLPASIRRRITGSSWHQGCPVSRGRLRHLRIGYWGFDREVHRGAMIVNASAVADIRTAFERLFSKRFPIRRMRLVDTYGASDFASIEADNTSAFNCRRVSGSSRWSEHAYGRAIDINPIENPYVYANGTTSHRASRPYLKRSPDRRGMAVRRRALVKAFDDVGWGWGGRWRPDRDYQHFSSTGR